MDEYARVMKAYEEDLLEKDIANMEKRHRRRHKKEQVLIRNLVDKIKEYPYPDLDIMYCYDRKLNVWQILYWGKGYKNNKKFRIFIAELLKESILSGFSNIYIDYFTDSYRIIAGKSMKEEKVLGKTLKMLRHVFGEDSVIEHHDDAFECKTATTTLYFTPKTNTGYVVVQSLSGKIWISFPYIDNIKAFKGQGYKIHLMHGKTLIASVIGNRKIKEKK